MEATATRVKQLREQLEPREITLHGHRLVYRMAGEGPLVLLIHGVTGSSDTWRDLMPWLAEHYTVVAPDLFGHGASAKPQGDYSLGAHASGIRDLAAALGFDRGTVVGHSLGGGIAMQFAYQFPERCERMVLISSGGLGREVNPLLRAATLPGSEYVLPVICHPRLLEGGRRVGEAIGRLGLRTGPDLAEIARGYGSLADADARKAFLQTVRAVIDAGGQRVSARDRLYLAAAMPTLIVWGANDPIIPAEHGRAAHGEMPGSRFEVFEDAGHFPHLNDPLRMADVLIEFIESTEPAMADEDDLRELLRRN